MSIQDFGSQFALDMQGLQRLKHTARQDASSGVDGAAQQFEALFLQMMMKSMRDAVPTTGLLSSKQTEFYQSLLDQQWAQTLAGRGVGLADHLVEQLEGRGLVQRPGRDGDDSDIDALIAGIPRGTPRVLQDALQPSDDGVKSVVTEADESAKPASFLEALDTQRDGFMAELAVDKPMVTTPEAKETAPVAGSVPNHVERFMERLSQPAQAASRRTGVPAELILAQAALETGWGRHEIPTAAGGNSHNLFGIKAGSRWEGKTTDITTHEYINGQRTRVTDSFRVYDSFEAAFIDYARLISDNPRYAAVTTAGSPEGAARALQSGGYATDPSYADKLIAVMNSMGTLPESESVAQLFFRY